MPPSHPAPRRGHGTTERCVLFVITTLLAFDMAAGFQSLRRSFHPIRRDRVMPSGTDPG